MDGVHDMGGMHGFGPVVHEESEPVFHERWEGFAFALGGALSKPLNANIDAGRHAMELLPPATYLSASYYERWLLRAERRLIELGILTEEDLANRLAYYQEHPDAPVPR